MKKKIFMPIIFLVIAFLVMRADFSIFNKSEDTGEQAKYKEITGIVKKGETLFDIFKRYNLNLSELFKIKEASANIHRLREIYPGQPYRIIIDNNNQINSFIYRINDDSVLNICRTESGFCAEKKDVEYEKRILHMGGGIKDNLVVSIGNDDEGKSLKKAFLKAPLSFRRVSSGFSINRFHPVLKIYRPHHGIDYAAPIGTPVSAIGDGTVVFTGRKGQYGNLVIIRHPNGYKTYYGHLSRFGSGIKSGTKIKQGQIIGYVGSTGLATGPHLHYEMRVSNRPVNPVAVKTLRGSAVPKKLMAEFRGFKNQMDGRLASITPAAVVLAKK